jgi:hypothetical protein
MSNPQLRLTLQANLVDADNEKDVGGVERELEDSAVGAQNTGAQELLVVEKAECGGVVELKVKVLAHALFALRYLPWVDCAQ